MTTLRYLAALAAIAMLAFTGYWMMDRAIQTQKDSAAIINASGRRRMLSQRAAYFSRLVVTEKTEEDREFAKGLLKEATTALEKNHNGLIHGDVSLNLSGNPSPALKELYFSPETRLDEGVNNFILNAKIVLDEGASDEKVRLAQQKIFADIVGPYFKNLDHSVSLYQAESEDKYLSIIQGERYVFIATLILLIIEALFVFRPLTVSFGRLLGRVEEKSAQLQSLLDHSGQGFLSFDSRGLIGDSYSRTVELLFGVRPEGLHLSKIMRKTEEEWNGFIELLFNDRVPFDSLVAVCPQSITVAERVIDLQYRQLLDSQGTVNRMMMIATDVTLLKAAERRAEAERDMNKALVSIIGAKGQFTELLTLLSALPAKAENEAEIKRALHTLKGGFAFFGLRESADQCHALESEIKISFDKTKVVESLRLIAEGVEKFLARYERVLNLNSANKGVISVSVDRIDHVIHTAASEQASTRTLNSIQSLKEVSLEDALGWLDGVFKNTARDLGKSVSPIVWQPSPFIAAEKYQKLLMTLIHVVRNAADHGIESPSVREAQGKPRAGQLQVRLVEGSGFYTLVFRDDGKGVDISRVRAKADALGLNVDDMSDEAILDLLFTAGFSTNEKVSELSGRGVGLDAVRIEARHLGGDTLATNFPGKGLQIEVRFQK